MPFFHRRGSGGSQEPPPDPAAEAAEVAAAVAALEQGGLPPRAVARLNELRQGTTTLFTSDVSVNEFAMMTRHGLRPVCQVMGSSIYHIGWQGNPGWNYGYSQGIYRMQVVSDAWNHARRLALSRLQQEARHAGADAVVAVRLRWGAHDFAPGSVEMVAIGTAVSFGGATPREHPILTDLSGQEVALLLDAGYNPVGVVASTDIFYVVPNWSTQRVTTGGYFGGSWSNTELPDFTQAIYRAREEAIMAINRDAQVLGAHGIVGVSFQQDIREHEVEINSVKRIDLVVTLHVLGTGIAPVPGHPQTLPDIRTNLNLSVP